ncbi:uncharacterized protein si:dkey-154b15.1 [Anoplopoma fimbria]|uniref:uncharacterized protein si:dkey-154b15.1 n=1 Tax=Anoplopoma fimbria TaxID=229290 RepID=UPI0023EC95E4|nr:uncharacterized protein si:dkey-154b15.1 [Anoplopoma fimbria]
METDGLEERTRTVVVTGVADLLTQDRMVDKLTIHFQSRRSSGGDVEEVKYPTNMDGVAFVTFHKAEDAERVVRKERHIMMDDEFPTSFIITVFPFTRDVFLYVPSATVDLSVFGTDQISLIQSLRSTHRSLRFRTSLQQMKATIEGPFSAVQALRQDLILRAGLLKSDGVSARAATTKLRETTFNPRVISHREVVGSVSRGGSEAKPGPGSSNCLSTPPQTTGEAAGSQSPLSNGKKTGNHSPRQKASQESLAVWSFDDTHGDGEEKKRNRSRLETPREKRTEGAKSKPRQVLKAGTSSSSSGLDLQLAEDISAKQPVDGYSEKHKRPDRIRGENPMDYLKDRDQSRSDGTAKIPPTKYVSTSYKSDTLDTEKLSAVSPEVEGDESVWVDSYAFRYIEKFEKCELDSCLRGLDARVIRESADLTRISLTERETSKTGSRVQQASEALQRLVAFQELMLRVHQIDFDEQTERQKLVEICRDVNVLYPDVLYLLEDSCVKVIGPMVSSHLFFKRLEEKVLDSKTLRM